VEYSNKINDSEKTVVLVDDGAASGATLIVSAQWIKKEERTSIQKIDKVIPVAPKETASLLEKSVTSLKL
jgi:putative phosphoribosyl transferase